MVLDIQQLKTFQAAAKHENYSAAAEELSLSQPAVSRQIDRLEQYLQVNLFYKVGRQMKLTAIGKEVKAKTDQILALVNSTTSLVQSINELETGSLRLGASTTIGNYSMAPMIMKFMEKYPHVDIKLDIKSTAEMKKSLRQEMLDIAVIPETPESNEFEAELFVEDEIVFVASPHHPIVKKEKITIEDLAQERWILRDPNSNTRKTMQHHLLSHGFVLPEGVELGSTEAVKQAVITGGGIAFLSKMTFETERQLGVLQALNVENIACKRHFYVVHHRHYYPTPAVDAFISFLTDKIDL
ncbi:LysR family transcriptional regulator [Alteribacillus iranensis]|uniref:DNA-binding transcriptional regulator, LysR family n=1 Tax=Alteribacillus iranensis TaxID=930128 RepID=A0A1I2FHK7_9BACI|nr:LysR family transcriptional regulator [Alteribacillus iranensis]SFF04483.1 DNA-binding transcriptional regulator, LysR family [Alteribacillus iranensis]